eukprot:1140635-Pelagomonas_calceolata.AAC.9
MPLPISTTSSRSAERERATLPATPFACVMASRHAMLKGARHCAVDSVDSGKCNACRKLHALSRQVFFKRKTTSNTPVGFVQEGFAMSS